MIEISNQEASRAGELLRALDFAQVIVHFSGGNDDGGIESQWEVHAIRDEEGLRRRNGWRYEQTTSGQWRHVELLVSGRQGAIDALVGIADEALDRAFGTWAGDFYARGEITFSLNDQGEGIATVAGGEREAIEYDDEDDEWEEDDEEDEHDVAV